MGDSIANGRFGNVILSSLISVSKKNAITFCCESFGLFINSFVIVRKFYVWLLWIVIIQFFSNSIFFFHFHIKFDSIGFKISCNFIEVISFLHFFGFSLVFIQKHGWKRCYLRKRMKYIVAYCCESDRILKNLKESKTNILEVFYLVRNILIVANI